MDKIIKIINCILLLGIFIVLVLILRSMPPNFGDFIRARSDKDGLKELSDKVPMVATYGPIDVSVINTVDVNVENTPLYVEEWQKDLWTFFKFKGGKHEEFHSKYNA